jgi:hypothetical protein
MPVFKASFFLPSHLFGLVANGDETINIFSLSVVHCLLIISAREKGLLPHVVDDEIIWSQLFVLHTARVMGTNVEHSLSPVCLRIDIIIEDAITIIAESANSFRRGVESYKVA